jgi:RNA polymerase sigma-70 factor (ECF subfamily)
MHSRPTTDREYAEVRQSILRFARWSAFRASDMEDAVQEALLADLENPLRYKGESRYSTYLMGILRFKLVDAHRDRSKIVNMEEAGLVEDALPAPALPGDLSQPEYRLEQLKRTARVRLALQSISRRSASALDFEFMQGYTRQETCDVLGVTAGNLDVMHFRARDRLRKVLSRPDW